MTDLTLFNPDEGHKWLNSYKLAEYVNERFGVEDCPDVWLL